MADSLGSGATRSSARIRNNVRRDLKKRLLASPASGRPRTRAQKAVLAGDSGRRRANLYDHFLISKADSRRSKRTTDANDSPGDTTDSLEDDDYSVVSDAQGDNPASKRRAHQQPRRSRRTAKKPTLAKGRRHAVTNTAARKPEEAPPKQVVIPNWIVPAMQPYWGAILAHAATEAGYLNRSWLLEASTVCKAFAEPALDVLYSSPAITTEAKLQKLVATLSRPSTMFSYPSKIHSLHLGPRFIPTNSMIETLLIYLPRLRHFSIDHELDQAPFRDLTTLPRRSYPDIWKLLEERVDTRPGMIQQPSRLLSWRWSWRLLGSLTMDTLIQLHTIGPLRELKSLHLVNFPSLGYIPPTEDVQMSDVGGGVSFRPRSAQDCAKVITPLKFLEHVALEACFAVDGEFLSHLPRDLKHLEIIQCWNLQAAHLSEFLLTHGKNLRSLTLRNNQSLDLSFLTVLRDACPNLEELEVNMSYFKDPETNNSEPLFDFALSEDQVPSWPSSIRHIELLHIRPWSYDAAVMFLQSLIRESRNLPNLRYLVIKSMLDLDWRKRAMMRDEWRSRLENVFLRPPSKAPEPWTSIPKQSKPPEPSHDEAEAAVEEKPVKEVDTSRRRSSRIIGKDDKDGHPSAVVTRRSRRNYAEPPTDAEDDSDSDSSGDDGDDVDMADVELRDASNSHGDHIQGLCRRVELTIENHKLAELQYDMDDFVDGASSDESSSDSDFI